LSTRSRLWIVASAGLVLVQIAASCVLPQGFALTAISQIVLEFQLIGLLGASILNALATRSRLRSFWVLLALSWFLGFVDQSFWVVYGIVFRSSVPAFFLGDLVVFMSAVPILAGFLLRPHLEPSEFSVRFGIIDFFQLMLWWIFVYVYAVICWQYVSVNLTAYNANYDRLNIAGTVATIVVLVLLVFQSAGKWRLFYAAFLGCFIFHSLSSVATNHAIEVGTYYDGSWFDIIASASFAFFTVVTVIGGDLSAASEPSRESRFGVWTSCLAAIAVLSLPVILIITALDRPAVPVIFRFRAIVTSVATLMMTALILLKQHRLRQDLRSTNEFLEDAALNDPLTGIRNRRYFQAMVERDVAQTLREYSARRDTCPHDLIFYMVDMDNFKAVNDLYGHDAGDRALIQLTRRIGSTIRNSDVLVRWGGEEFLIVSRAADRKNGSKLAERVLQVVRGTPFRIDQSRLIPLTCSVGWAAFPWFENDPETIGYNQVINLADQALRKAKNAGKDRAFGAIPSEVQPGLFESISQVTRS